MLAASATAGPAASLALDQGLRTGGGSLTVGRTEENVVSMFRLNQAAPPGLAAHDKLVNMVSRQHARLGVVAGQLQVEDLGTVNGTYVNDHKIAPRTPRVLQDNDVVSVGGPTQVMFAGAQRPNPWVWHVRNLQQFLASYVPPDQPRPPALPPAALAQAGGQTGRGAAAAAAPAREVFRFSPGPPAGTAEVEPVAAAAEEQELDEEEDWGGRGSPVRAAEVEAAEEGEGEQGSPAGDAMAEDSALPGQPRLAVQTTPAAGAAEAGAAGQMVAAEPEPAAAAEVEAAAEVGGAAAVKMEVEAEEEAEDAAGADGGPENSEELDLLALEQYLASQEASAGGGTAAAAGSAAAAAAQAGPAAAAAEGAQPAAAAAESPLPPGAIPVQGRGAAAEPLPPGAMPVLGPTRPVSAEPAELAPQPVPQAAAGALAQPAGAAGPAEEPLPPGAMPVRGSTLPVGPIGGGSGQAAEEAGTPAASAAAATPQPVAAAAEEVDLIDLTADSPSPRSVAAQAPAGQRGRPSFGGSVASAGGSYGAAAAIGAAPGVDFVDLSISPSKRRHGTAARSPEQEQARLGAKRAKPSPEGPAQGMQGGMGADSGEAAGPASAAAGGAAGGAAGPSTSAAAAAGPAAPAGVDHLAGMQQELICAICQEVLVAAHNMYPCNHSFCGQCLAEWLSKGKRECPTCRVKSTAAPSRNHMIDNICAMFAKSLPADDQESRAEKVQFWDEHKERLEGQMKAPFERGGGRGGSGRGGGAGGGEDRTMAALAALLAGGGNPFMAAPLLHEALGLDDGEHVGAGAAGGGGAGRRRGAAVTQRAPAPAFVLPQRREFKAEVAGPQARAQCTACRVAIGENVTRVGAKARGHAGGFRWYHLTCFPAELWREAAIEGMQNLRGVPARDQAFIRDRFRPAR